MTQTATDPAAHGQSTPALEAILATTADEARDELRRADTKAAALLTTAGVATTVTAAALARLTLTPAPTSTAVTALALLASAVMLLLDAVRPRRGKATRVAWPHYATLTPCQLTTELAAWPHHDYLAARTVELSRIVAGKYRATRHAVALLHTALAALALTGLLTLLT